jgi:hypothetical protein
VIGNLTPAQAVAQQAAELLWACATSEDHGVAWYRSAVYQGAEAAFLSAAKLAYGLYQDEAEAVRDLLSEYGPHDALQGTSGRGVFSYVQAAFAAKLEAEDEARAFAAEDEAEAADLAEGFSSRPPARTEPERCGTCGRAAHWRTAPWQGHPWTPPRSRSSAPAGFAGRSGQGALGGYPPASSQALAVTS